MSMSEICGVRRRYTEAPLHTDAFTRRRFYTQTFLHTNSFNHRPFYTKTLLHTDAFIQRLCTQTLLHTGALTHKGLTWLDTQTCLHSGAFTHRALRWKFQNRNFTTVFADRTSFCAKGFGQKLLPIEPHFVRKGWAGSFKIVILP